jgi:hypothetical protein
MGDKIPPMGPPMRMPCRKCSAKDALDSVRDDKQEWTDDKGKAFEARAGLFKCRFCEALTYLDFDVKAGMWRVRDGGKDS